MAMSKESQFRSALPEMFAQHAVGPETRVRLGVGIFIRDEQGWVLLEQRADCGWWGLPGGKLEVGETISQTAVREVKEETGLDIDVVRLIGIYSELYDRIVTYPDTKDGIQLIDVVVEGKVLSGHLTCSDESLDLRYFSPTHLPDELIPPCRKPVGDGIQGVCGILG